RGAAVPHRDDRVVRQPRLRHALLPRCAPRVQHLPHHDGDRHAAHRGAGADRRRGARAVRDRVAGAHDDLRDRARGGAGGPGPRPDGGSSAPDPGAPGSVPAVAAGHGGPRTMSEPVTTEQRSLAHWAEDGRAGMEAFYALAIEDYRRMVAARDWAADLRGHAD